MTEEQDATYMFGTYEGKFTLSMPHTEYTAYGQKVIPAGDITLRPWVLKHVTNISEGVTTMATTIGIPDKPPECAQVYDIGGPVRTITISGKRYDSEEEVSNLDFIHTQFNPFKRTQAVIPFHGTQSVSYYSVGIEWLTSTMQTTLKGYTFIIEMPSSDTRMSSQQLNVGLTGFTYNFENDNPGVMNYTIQLVERNEYKGGPIYREYIRTLRKG